MHLETLHKGSLHERLMDTAYRTWDTKYSYTQFIENLPATQRAAVLTGNLIWNVDSGGFQQWDHNGFSSGGNQLLLVLRDMSALLEKGDASRKVSNLVAQAMTELRRYRALLQSLPSGAPQDLDSVRALSDYSQAFHHLSSDFKLECERYLTLTSAGYPR